MIEVHNSSVEEDKEGRHIFTPRARRIMKSRFGGFSAPGAGIVILIPSLFNGGPSNHPPWKVIREVVLNGVECEGRGGGLLGRVLLVRRVVARASECVSRV